MARNAQITETLSKVENFPLTDLAPRAKPASLSRCHSFKRKSYNDLSITCNWDDSKLLKTSHDRYQPWNKSTKREKLPNNRFHSKPLSRICGRNCIKIRYHFNNCYHLTDRKLSSSWRNASNQCALTTNITLITEVANLKRPKGLTSLQLSIFDFSPKSEREKLKVFMRK